MSVHRRRFRKWDGVNRGATIAASIFLVAVFLIVLFIIGSPRMLLRFAAPRVSVLPSWLFLLLFFIFYALCGASIGAVLFCGRANEVAKYRGAFFFGIALTASYLWYALTFGARFFLPSILLAAVSVCCFAVAAVNFRFVFRLSSWGAWFAVAWAAYLLILSLLFFFFV